MSRGKEIKESQDQEEIEGIEEDYEEEEICYYDNQNDSNEKFLDLINKNSFVFDRPRSKKPRKCEASYDNCKHSSNSTIISPVKSQDADYFYSHLPQLSNHLEMMIIARIPLLEFRKISLINKTFSKLVKNGGLLRERKLIGVREASVFMLASGEKNWWAFDQKFTSQKALPILPSDDVFKVLDKESVTAGTHLLVCGTDVSGPVIWAYEVLTNKWFKGASMNEPRCLFGSASTGDFAFVAGGLSLKNRKPLKSAEKYDPVTQSWVPLPNMKVKRKMCAGFYMDDKFYVIGGQGENENVLACGEFYDEAKNEWNRIPGILNGLTQITSGSTQSPPLVAVVNNELYTIETTTNWLMVYMKESNCWKGVGPVPVRADISNGWGVAFKSLGNELLVIGGSTMSVSGRGMSVYTCCPNPNDKILNWKLLDCGGNRSHFIMNCTIMMA